MNPRQEYALALRWSARTTTVTAIVLLLVLTGCDTTNQRCQRTKTGETVPATYCAEHVDGYQWEATRG